MHVTEDMIAKDLRARGRLVHLVYPKTPAMKFQFPGIGPGNMHIQRDDGTRLRLLVKRPRNVSGKVPGVLWIHGGGLVSGMPEMLYFTRGADVARKCVVVSPDYTLAAIRPYPAAIEDCYLALLWMVEHADELGIRRNQIFIGGESAGGGLTVATCLLARDTGDVSIACQMPLYPMLDDRMQTPSMHDNNAPIWDEDKNRKAWSIYLGGLGQGHIPTYAAPGRATDLSNMPPAISFVGSIEPFLDETVGYMQALEAAGSDIMFEIFEGCYHAFDIIAPNSREGRLAKRFFDRSLDYAIQNFVAEN